MFGLGTGTVQGREVKGQVNWYAKIALVQDMYQTIITHEYMLTMKLGMEEPQHDTQKTRRDSYTPASV